MNNEGRGKTKHVGLLVTVLKMSLIMLVSLISQDFFVKQWYYLITNSKFNSRN